ncbi:MAG: Coenzyme F420 hydrogenase/dehydrogenase, beta subunit C-terminal domain [Lachnospiraceae bacterium]|nr:Coenzyme F420 hydrogenase/dehydrogenase, beta subunit C-terminal domain [Lachnospiraceae bacterium]
MNISEQNCCGCGACMQICPQNAIQMKKNAAGFFYPSVNQDKCVSCGLCEKVCKYSKEENEINECNSVYVAVGTDVELKASASGGLFASFAQSIIEQGGVVFGCALVYEDEQLWPRHTSVESVEELKALKGSKYVQSDTGDSYYETKQQLLSGRKVLYSGTPCQIAGLKGYLGKKYSNLFTVEIICHGVPNVEFFHSYLSYIEEKYDIKIIEFRFRDKQEGWKLHGSITYIRNDGMKGEAQFEPEESSYYQMFLNSYTYRKNCYSCPYASENRQGDVTIGDFWCIDLVHPELLKANSDVLNEQNGISCLIINSQQGERLLEQYGNGVKVWSSSYTQAARYNAQLKHPSELKPERKIVLDLYEKTGYSEVEKWYQSRLRKIKNRRKIAALVPEGVKKLLRPIIHPKPNEK